MRRQISKIEFYIVTAGYRCDKEGSNLHIIPSCSPVGYETSFTGDDGIYFTDGQTANAVLFNVLYCVTQFVIWIHAFSLDLGFCHPTGLLYPFRTNK
jgi:hypothetical protein